MSMQTTTDHTQPTCLRNVTRFLKRQMLQTRKERREVMNRKMKRSLHIFLKLPFYVFAVFAVLVSRMIRPVLLLRWGALICTRIGHFAANTEIYLCERDAGINVPKQRYVDLFYMGGPICNQQLASMWRRVLHVWPSWVLGPISRINRMIIGGAVHEIGNNTQDDRDVHNLYEQFPPHLEFTIEEEKKGCEELNKLGIPNNASYICFHARNPQYLKKVYPKTDFSYHDFLDADIKNFIPAGAELCRRGNFLVRIGAVVGEPLEITHPMIIDYAWNHRSDFLDIYLGSKCKFYLLSPTGIYAVPSLFRRPLAFVNMVPVEYIVSWGQNNLSIFKRYWLIKENRFMSFREILNSGSGQFLSTEQYEQLGIELIENTPEEITELAIEMDERLNGTWQTTGEDEELQRRFWEIFPTDAVDAYQGHPLHGEIRARFGAHFLRNNRWWLD